MLKMCEDCGEWKHETAFNWARSGAGKSDRCKACQYDMNNRNKNKPQHGKCFACGGKPTQRDIETNAGCFTRAFAKDENGKITKVYVCSDCYFDGYYF